MIEFSRVFAIIFVCTIMAAGAVVGFTVVGMLVYNMFGGIGLGVWIIAGISALIAAMEVSSL